MALLANDPTDRAGQILALTRRLTALIEADIALIAAQKPLTEGEAGGEKARLANAYRTEMARIERDPSLLAGLPGDLKAELRAATERMQEALASYAVRLRQAKDLTEGLVQALAEEVRRQRAVQAGYGAGGAYVDGGAQGVAMNRSA